MAKQRREAVGAVVFCGGVLVTWRTPTSSPHYEAKRGVPSGDGVWIGFYDGVREARVNTVDTLLAIGKERGASLEHAAAANPMGFADVFKVLSGLDRVVVPGPLHDFMKDQHDFDPAQHAPRVAGATLRFVTVAFRFDQPPVLAAVEVDLATGRISTQPVQG